MSIRALLIIGLLWGVWITASGQKYIVRDDQFKPYEQRGDTIYFNPKGYAYVKTITYYAGGCIQKIYSLENKFTPPGMRCPVRYTAKPYEKRYYKRPGYGGDRLHTVWYRKDTMNCRKSTVHLVKARRNYYAEESALMFPGAAKNDDTIPTINLDKELFPDLTQLIDSFSLVFHYDDFQNYSVTIYRGDSIHATITTSMVCNPENPSGRPIPTAGELEATLNKRLASIKLPVLNVYGHILPYHILFNYRQLNYIWLRVNQEIQSGYNHSIRLFADNPNTYVYPDSFNNVSIFYNIDLQGGYGPSWNDYPLLNVSGIRADIENGGRQEFVLDTFITTKDVEGHTSLSNIIRYIPVVENATYQYYLRRYGQVIQTLEYTLDLGNHFYYIIDNSTSCIFYMLDGEKHTIISFAEVYNPRKNNFYSTAFVLNNALLTRSENMYREEGRKIKQETIRLIEDYITHPEKLYLDFPKETLDKLKGSY